MQRLMFDEQRRVVQAGLMAGKIADRELQFAFQQPALQFVGRNREHLDQHVRRLFAKTADGRRDRFDDVRREPFGQTHPQLAEQRARHVLRVAREHVHRLQEPPRRLQHALAFRRQPEAALAAIAQPEPEARLELGHLRADGRRRHAERALRGAEAAALGDRQEQPQQLQIHVSEPGQHGNTSHFVKSAYVSSYFSLDAVAAESGTRSPAARPCPLQTGIRR